MKQKEGQIGENRRKRLLELLKTAQDPLKAVQLAQQTGVSRQVIVQDIALLRAGNQPIMATPKGYVFLGERASDGIRQVIYSLHAPKDTEQELNILVDHGICVLDVGVEHPLYGKIWRSLNLKTRLDVKRFMEKMTETEASLLSSLTEGRHLHTLEAPNQETLDLAIAALKKIGFLAEN
ncbi:MAG TPA: transcription repressor NadR [Desulfobacteria bacterium]|nr:transcription repressor NadR [Desulfobacteria bacterium]